MTLGKTPCMCFIHEQGVKNSLLGLYPIYFGAICLHNLTTTVQSVSHRGLKSSPGPLFTFGRLPKWKMVLESTSRPMQLTSACCCLNIAVQAWISGLRDGQVFWDKGGFSCCNPCLQRSKPPNLVCIKLQLIYLRVTKFLNTQNIQMG